MRLKLAEGQIQENEKKCHSLQNEVEKLTLQTKEDGTTNDNDQLTKQLSDLETEMDTLKGMHAQKLNELKDEFQTD